MRLAGAYFHCYFVSSNKIINQTQLIMRLVNVVFLACLMITLNWSCKVKELSNSIDKGIEVIDEGIEKITNESALWRGTLEDIHDRLPEDLDNAKENVSQLIAEGVGMAGSNAVCVVDAIPKRVIRGLQVVRAKLTGEPIPILKPTVCQTSLAVIDLNQPLFLRDKILIYGYDFREDSYLTLSIKDQVGIESLLLNKLFKLSDYQYSIILSDMEDLLKNSISVVLRFDNEILSEFAVIQENIPDPRQETFVIPDTDKLFPNHTEGDREFDGHGPDVNMSATLEIVNAREVWVRINYYLRETTPDWSTASGAWNFKVFTASGDKKILSIESSSFSNASYRDTDHSIDIPSVSGGLVSQFLSKGDTGGNDIGNNTNDDSHLIVKFNPVTIMIQD